MSEVYTPNEKRLKMFGAQAQGYSMNRVDMYLDKLEGAYTQLRSAYEQLKAAPPPQQAPQPPQPAMPDPQVQELHALNAHLQQEAQLLRNENGALKAKVSEVEARVSQLNSFQASQSAEGAIARALLAAQEKADEMLQGAQLEAQGIIGNARNQVEQLKAERIRARKQLEGIRYALDGILAAHKPDGLQGTSYGLDI